MLFKLVLFLHNNRNKFVLPVCVLVTLLVKGIGVARGTSNDDIWSMTASMNVADGGTQQHYLNVDRRKSGSIDGEIVLDDRSRYLLEWRIEQAKNKVHFALIINKTDNAFNIGHDVFALGFSDRGELVSSDFCLIWYDLGHKIHLQDALVDSQGKLELVDSSESSCRLQRLGRVESTANGELKYKNRGEIDDETDNNGEVEESLYEIAFERPLKVCGPKGAHSYYVIDDGTTHLVWFTLKGPLLSMDNLNLAVLSDDKSSSDGRAEQHLHRLIESEAKVDVLRPDHFEHGLRRVQLWSHKQRVPQPPPSLGSGARPSGQQRAPTHDIRMSNYSVPAQETTYRCRLFKLPSKFEARRYHITRYEAVIEPVANSGVVHHMELFNCANLSPQQELELDELWANGGWSGDCNEHKSRPKATEPCRKVILAWAMGARPLDYPEQVGQSIGGEGYSPYVVLEVHYNNAEQKGGLMDSSGLRFHYTSKLRLFDAGVLEVGLEYTDKNSIPPGLVTPLAGYCVSECTRAAMSGLGWLSAPVAATSNFRPTGHSHGSRRTSGRKTMGVFGRSSDSGDGGGGESLAEGGPATIEGRRREWRANDKTVEGAAVGRGPLRSRRTGQPASEAARKGSGDETRGRARSGLEDGIYIFAAQMHTHLAGVASWTEHVREGRLLGELQRDNHYSPHFQEIRLLKEPVRVAPGDALVHYCLYDTRDRPNVTLGGFSTSDEMCVTYLHYYPRIDLEVCKSSVDTSALESYFAYLSREEGQNTSANLLLLDDDDDADDEGGSLAGLSQSAPAAAASNKSDEPSQGAAYGNEKRAKVRSVSDNYKSIKWSPKLAEDLIRFYSEAPLSVQCNRSDGQRFPGYWNGIMPTKVFPSDRVAIVSRAPASAPTARRQLGLDQTADSDWFRCDSAEFGRPFSARAQLDQCSISARRSSTKYRGMQSWSSGGGGGSGGEQWCKSSDT